MAHHYPPPIGQPIISPAVTIPPPPPPPPNPCGYGAIQCATAPPPGGQLPFTGAEVWALVAFAIVCLLVGVVGRFSGRVR